MHSYLRYTFLLILFLIGSCASQKKERSAKPRSLSNAQSDLLDVSSTIFHKNDSLTDIFVRVSNEHLLYRRPDTTKAFYAELNVRYRLFKEENKRTIIDSGSFVMLDRFPLETVPPRNIGGRFSVKAKEPTNYLVEMDFIEVIRKTVYKKSCHLEKTSDGGRQFYLVKANDSVVFTNRFSANNELLIAVADKPREKIYVDYFSKNFGPALPPFSTKQSDPFKYKPDSTFEIDLYNNQFFVKTPPWGFYHFKKQRDGTEGLSIFTVDESFPGVSNSGEMISCTRYIMFKEEFEACRDAVDKKAAIDEFWLNIGGSNERARELLKRYYTRVQEANKAYSSYTQGWKTDRGMIYIVLGPPANVYTSAKDEVWMYGNESNPNALKFVFNKTKNPFTENDYVLVRSAFYKESYHTAVEVWRQGLVYVDKR